LNEEAVKKINSWIAEGKNYEVIKLYGFCDWKGTNSYNDTLALKRVTTVYDFLKASKIEVKKTLKLEVLEKILNNQKFKVRIAE